MWQILKIIILCITAPVWGPPVFIYLYLYKNRHSNRTQETLEWAKKHNPAYYQQLKEWVEQEEQRNDRSDSQKN